MLITFGEPIGISLLQYYLPAGRCSLAEYLQRPADHFTWEKMQRFWKASYFETEFFYRFLSQEAGADALQGLPLDIEQVNRTITEIGFDFFYSATEESSADMALTVARQLLSGESGLAGKIQALFYCHSTLNEEPFTSTACWLQYELKLKKAFVTSVSQSGGNAAFAAIQMACEMLLAEPELTTILIVSSDKFIPPYRRTFGTITALGDGASAMVIRTPEQRSQILALHWRDFPEWWNLSQRSVEQMAGFNEFLTLQASSLINEILPALHTEIEEVALIIPPSLNVNFGQLLAARVGISPCKVYTGSLKKFGYLATSDLTVTLASALAEGRARRDDLVLVLSAGLGASLGCMALRV